VIFVLEEHFVYLIYIVRELRTRYAVEIFLKKLESTYMYSANLRQAAAILNSVKSHIPCQNSFWLPNIYQTATVGEDMKPQLNYYNLKIFKYGDFDLELL